LGDMQADLPDPRQRLNRIIAALIDQIADKQCQNRGRTITGVRPECTPKQTSPGMLREPLVSHFMQVPFRTSVECRTRCTSRFSSSSPRRAGFGPSYASRFSAGENPCSGSAVFSAVAASPWRGGRSGRRRGDRGEVAKSAVQIQRNARRSRPCVPDTQLHAARSQPQSGGHSGQVSPIEASTSRTSATAGHLQGGSTCLKGRYTRKPQPLPAGVRSF
jgi:hypothetical protein